MIENKEDDFETARLKMLRMCTRGAAISFLREYAYDPKAYIVALDKPEKQIMLHVHLARLEHKETTEEEKAISNKFLIDNKDLYFNYVEKQNAYESKMGLPITNPGQIKKEDLR